MPKNGDGKWTSERRPALHSKVSAEARRRKRRRITPKAIAHFSKTGLVCEELRPLVEMRRAQYSLMVADLGDEATQLQKGMLDCWLHAMIAGDAQLARILENPHSERTIERLATCLNTARGALSMLGLQHRVSQVEAPTLEQLVDTTATIEERPESSPEVEDDRPTQTNVARPSVFAQLRARAARELDRDESSTAVADEHEVSSPVLAGGES